MDNKNKKEIMDKKNKAIMDKKINKAIKKAKFINEKENKDAIYFQRLDKFIKNQSKEKKTQYKICTELLNKAEKVTEITGKKKNSLRIVVQYMQYINQ